MKQNRTTKTIAFGFVIVVVSIVSFMVYGLALTPEELKQRKQQGSTIDWSSVGDDPSRKIELRMLIGSTGREGSWIERLLEKRFNIEIKPVFLGPAAYSYAKPLMLAGGDVPDIMLEPDPIMVQRDAYHGFLMQLPRSVILKHAPTYVKTLGESDPVGWLYANWNGRNYGIPNVFPSLRWSVPGIWRKDWLDAVGIEKIPETIDEMHEALKRFTFNDPDGDGKQNTWGMSGDVTHWWWASFGDIYGAFGVTPYDWMDVGGKAVYGGIRPETRDALALLRSWYKEGIIHPDFVTDKNRETLHCKFENGVIGYLYYQGKYAALDLKTPGSLAQRMKKLNPKANVVCGWLPLGPTGKRGSRVWSGGHVIAFGRHMETRPEAVVRVLKIFEQIVTNEDLYLKTHLGKRGTHWDFVDPEVGPSSGVVRIGDYTDPNAAKRELLGSIEGCTLFPHAASPEFIDRYTAGDEVEFNHRYRNPKWALKDALGKPDSVPSAGRYLGDLRNYQMTVFAEIIRGDKDLSYFDEFVKNWLARGGQQMTNEATELLRTKFDIYREVGVTTGGGQ